MLYPSASGRRHTIDPARLSAARLVPPPIGARRLARGIGLLFLLTLIGIVITPWQQNISGAGRIIAYAPKDRRQRIQAPVKGIIVEWMVNEGQHVTAGTPLVVIQDNDPNYFSRLEQGREAVITQLAVYRAQVEQLGGYVSALEDARDRAVEQAQAEIREAEQKLRAVRQKLAAAEAARETARINLERTVSLRDKGLVSQRKLELAQLKARKTETDAESMVADVVGAENALASKEASLESKRASAEAKVANARASQGKAKVSVQDAQAKVIDFDVKLARQSTREVVAPVDSYVLRLIKAPGQEQIKEGDLLAELVPDTANRVAEVYVDGNDAAIIAPGRKVRLQFEGWPAVQFAGWPSVAIGTFGGVVQFVDSADDGKGDFRLIVRRDPDDELGWPNAKYLRQGTRTKAWILLEQVSLGYEMWRRFNGFPPATRVAPTGDGKVYSKGASPGKGHSK